MNTSRLLRHVLVPIWFALTMSFCLPTGAFAAEPKPRLVVMTDIGGDPDDEQSIVRFLLYACDFEVEGLCTGFGYGHYEVTHLELLHKAVDAYGQVLPSLLKHRADFPSHDQLQKLIKDGSNGDPHSVGPGRDSEASFSRLPVGTYAVFAHVFEDNDSERLNFFVERRPVVRNHQSGDAGHWQRLGPWVARVNDGTLVLTSEGGAANLSGIELWKLNETTGQGKE